MNDQAQKLRELVRAQSQNFPTNNSATSNKKTPRTCKVITVTSGKGGVGKTNIALFLAVALGAAKKKVLLLDADLGLANVHILLGSAPKFNLSHVISGQCKIDEVISGGPSGISIIPGASGLEELANLDIGRLEYLRHSLATLENSYDFVIIDTGAGISNATTQFASNADLVLLVMTPEPTSLADAYAMVKVLNEKGASRISTVVNMAVSDKDGTETFDRLNTIVLKFLKRQVELFGILPADNEIGRFVRKQKLFTIENPGSVIALRINNIARRICGVQIVENQGFFARLFRPKAIGTEKIL